MKLSILKISFLLIILLTWSSFAQDKGKKKEIKINFFGDVRLRGELDRNSKTIDGSKRDDRDRLRYRLRFGLNYDVNKNFRFGASVRSGHPANQQSPHVTIGDEFEIDDISIDKIFIKYTSDKGIWIWGGKNDMPFWTQNELLWNNNVNPEGLATGLIFKLNEKSNLIPVIGYFIAGHSGKNFNDDSNLFIGQIKFESPLENHKFILSTGVISAKNLPNKPDGSHTFKLDYTIWASSLQFKIKGSGLTAGFDYYKNVNNYKNNVDISEIFEDQTSGLVGSLEYQKNRYMVGYYYASIQKYAVIDYFAQDDWLRWGNNDYTRSSNFSGHEIKFKYSISNTMNTVLRFYTVKGIKTPGNTLETGTRLRLDFNIRF